MDGIDLDLEFPSDFDAQIERLDTVQPGPTFALKQNMFHRVAAKKEAAASRRGIKNMIKPENALEVLDHLPQRGEHTHCALRGDFVLCDIIPAIIEARGRAGDLLVATLGMSAANADCLIRLSQKGLVKTITIICSNYFRAVDKATTFREVATRLEGYARLHIARCHAKVIVLPVGKDCFVIEGSANLRSSDNTEQMTIFNDPYLAAFHRSWLLSLPDE